EYETIMDYLLLIGEPWLHWLGRTSADGILCLPDPERQSMILPPRAKWLSKFPRDGRMFSICSSHEGNSLIEFWDPLAPRGQRTEISGSIQLILQIPMNGFLRTFMFLNPHIVVHTPLYMELPDMMTTVVKASPPRVVTVIEPKHVIAHISAKRCPPGHFDQEETLVICSALNRGRQPST
ncbi:hypothetical protein C8F01DRAFT_970437, partial [Mycena amicta]